MSAPDMPNPENHAPKSRGRRPAARLGLRPPSKVAARTELAPDRVSWLRLPSASRTSGPGIPDLEPLVRVRTVDRFEPVTPEQFASRGSVWRRWRGWLR